MAFLEVNMLELLDSVQFANIRQPIKLDNGVKTQTFALDFNNLGRKNFSRS